LAVPAMTIFLESPWPAIGIGVFLEAVLVLLLLRSGRGILLAAMAGVAILTLGGVLLDWAVVTDREQVAATIQGGKMAVEANDLDRVFTYISPAAETVRTEARAVHRLGEFSDIRIHGLDIQVNRQVDPPTATAHFTAIANIKDRRAGLFDGTGLSGVHLQFHLESGRWLVTDFKVERLETEGSKR
jgi:hypothetical protein